MGKLKALVMTLGFEPGPLVSAMAAHASEGFGPGAEIMVLTPGFRGERAERAWRRLQDVFSMMRLSQLGVELHGLVVELEDFTPTVLRVKSLFAGLRDKRVEPGSQTPSSSALAVRRTSLSRPCPGWGEVGPLAADIPLAAVPGG